MSASTLVPTSLAQRLLSAVTILGLVLGVVRVGPLAPSLVDAAGGASASLRLTLEGPDTFGASLVTTGTRAVGLVFPVSVTLDTDGAAVNAFALRASYNPLDFHIVDPTTGADITSFPNNALTKGSVGLLFQNAASFPSAGATNVIDNATGSATLAFGASPSDTDTQIYSQSDSGAPAGYHNGTDRVVTMYFKAMRSVTSGAIGFAADAPTTTQQLIRYGDWMNLGTPSEADLYIDADASGTVTTGDSRLTDAGALLAATTVACPADADCGTALAGGRVAGALYRDLNSNSSFDLASDRVYLNLDYPNVTVTAGDQRVLPTGSGFTAGSTVAGGDADLSGALLPLNNVRQTGSGGTLTDLVGTVGVNLNGVTVTGTPPTSATTTAPSCAQTTVATTVTVTTSPVMQGVPVTLSSSVVSDVITPVAPLQNATTAQTNASGVATFTVTGTATGAHVFTGTAGGVTAATSTSTFQASACGGAVSPTTSTVTAAPSCVISNGTSQATITVVLRDSGSTPVSGATVSLAANPSGAVITGPTYTGGGSSTNSTGTATFTVVNTTSSATAVVFTATANGSTVITQTASVVFNTSCGTPISGANSGIAVSTSACTLANGTAAHTVVVTVRDTNNAVVSGASVTLLQSGSATIANPNPTTTSASGQAVFTVTATTAQTVSFTASATNANGTATITPSPAVSATFSATCGGVTISPTLSQVSVSTPACSGLNSVSNVNVTVRDTSNAVVSGATVILTAPGATISPSSTQTTSASGIASFTISSATTQNVTLTTTANNGSGAVTISNYAPSSTVAFNVSSCSASTFSISGNITGTTSAVSLALTGTSSATQSTSGGYIFGSLANGSYTVTPTLAGCTFSPTFRSATISGSNVTGQDFVATCGGTGTPTLSVSPICVVANGTGTSLTLQFSGSNTANAAVTNINVSPNTNVSVSPTSGTTSTNGMLTTTVNASTGAALGTRTIYATVNSTTTSASINVVSTSSGCGTSGTGVLASSTKIASNRDKIYKPGNSIDFTITARNSGTSSLNDVSVLDTKDRSWDSFNTSSVVVSPSSGTQNTTSSQLSISNMSVTGNGTTTVSYTQKLKSGSDLLDDLDIDEAADPKTDTDWWAENVVDSSTNASDNDSEDDALDAPDSAAFSLGGSSDPVNDDLITLSELDSSTSYLIVDFGDRVIVNTSGEDFLIKEQNAADDTDTAEEEYAVYASQDGNTFSLISKGNEGSKAFDLGKSDYDWAKQILIVDQTDDSKTKGKHEGVDIESVGIIHLGGLVKNTATLSSTSANSTANPSETIAVDVTSIMDNELNPCDFGIGTECNQEFSTLNSTAVGDPCYTLAGGNVTFTLRDPDNAVVPNQPITITAVPNDGVTIQSSPMTTDANGRITVRIASTKVQNVVFTFSATPSGSTTSQAVLTFTGVFKTSCTLPQTGMSVGAVTGMLVLSALPAAWIARRRWLKA